MSDNEEKTTKRFSFAFIRTNIMAGFFVALPLFVTYFVMKTIVVGLDSWLISAIPEKYQPSSLYPDVHIYGLGLIGGLVLLFIAGLFARNFLGKKLLNVWDSLMRSIPGVRTIYSATKQIVDTVSQTNSKSFREVVLVEYPRKGIWSIAFVTGQTKGEVQKVTDNDLVSIFLPTTPNPTSGFLLFIPKKDAIKLNMTVDQGIKTVISAGIVMPTITEGKQAIKEEKENIELQDVS
jgi:uncharacterized membrane protein